MTVMYFYKLYIDNIFAMQVGCQNYFNPFVNAAITLFQSLTGALKYANNTFSTSLLSTPHFSLEVTTLYPQYVSVTLGLVILIKLFTVALD